MKQAPNALKVASAVVLAGSSQAYGQVVFVTPPQNFQAADPTTQFSVEYYTVATGVTSFASAPDPAADFRFETYTGPGGYFFSDVETQKPGESIAVSGMGFYAAAIPNGTQLGSDTYTFNNSGFTVIAQVGAEYPSYQLTGVHQTLGFQIVGSDGALHNGYIELETDPYVSPSDPGGMSFFTAAYNQTPDGEVGGDITVPEPGTISSLVLGAGALAGVGLMRRRRFARG